MSKDKFSNILNWGEQLWDYKDVRSLLDEFLELYDNRPIIDNRGGCYLRIYSGHGIF